MAPAALAAPAASSITPAVSCGVRSVRAAAFLSLRRSRIAATPAGGLRGPSVRQRRRRLVPRSSTSESSSPDASPPTKPEKAPFGYTRKDVLLIGVGVTAFGYGLKSGLELLGVDPLQAGNAVQLVVVLGMTVAWISTYMFRVANKDMTYAQQLRNYEKQVMEKRLDSLSEVELQVLLEQVEEEKQRLPQIPDQPNGITFQKK